MKRIILICSLVLSLQTWGATFTYRDFTTLPLAKQKLILQTYRTFFAELSKQTLVSYHQQGSHLLQMSLFEDAYASSEYNCFYAGWPSVLRQSGGKSYCSSPLHTNPTYKSLSSACSQGQLLCQPALFGEGLCADVSSPSLRSQAYSQCERKFENENRTFDNVAAIVGSESLAVNADEMFATADEVCRQGSQAGGGMCRKLLQRVADIRSSQTDRQPVAAADLVPAQVQLNAVVESPEESSSQATEEEKSEPSEFEKLFSSFLNPSPEKNEPVPTLESVAKNVSTVNEVVKSAGVVEECEEIPFSRVKAEIENACQMRTPKDGYDLVTISECRPGAKQSPGGFTVRQGKEHPLYPGRSPYGEMSTDPYRTLNIFTGNGSLNSTYLYLEEIAGGPDSHDVKSVMILLPRKTVPQVLDQGDTLKFILPTGEAMVIDKKTHAILGGAMKEGLQDLNTDRFKRKPPNVQYAGSGISVRVDHRYLSPMEGATTATVTQGDKKCSVPASALFSNGEIKSSSDAEFLSAINANCKTAKFSL